MKLIKTKRKGQAGFHKGERVKPGEVAIILRLDGSLVLYAPKRRDGEPVKTIEIAMRAAARLLANDDEFCKAMLDAYQAQVTEDERKAAEKAVVERMTATVN